MNVIRYWNNCLNFLTPSYPPILYIIFNSVFYAFFFLFWMYINYIIYFFRFPLSKPDLLKKWISSVRRNNFTPTIHNYLCSIHFTIDCFNENYKSRRLLKDDAVPTIFNFPKHLKKVCKILCLWPWYGMSIGKWSNLPRYKMY